MESSGSRSSKRKKTGPIIKDMVEYTNMCTTQNVSELPIVTHYKKKINELTMNNKALSQALETSHRTIYHQNKVISNLEKKLVSEVPEVVLFKFQAIGTALKHVVDLVEEASILLKSKSPPNSTQTDANSQSAGAERIGQSQRKKHHHKRKRSPYKDVGNGIGSYSCSDHDSEEIDEIIAQFELDKNVRQKRKKCKRSTSKRGDNEMAYDSESLPDFRSQALDNTSSCPAIKNTPDADSQEQDPDSNHLLLKISNQPSTRSRPSTSKPSAYLESSRTVKRHSKARNSSMKSRTSCYQNDTEWSEMEWDSKSHVKRDHESRKSHRNRYATIPKPSTRTSSRNTSHSGNHSETTGENVRELRKKRTHINYDDTDDLNFIFDEDDGKEDNGKDVEKGELPDTMVDFKVNVKMEPEEILDNVQISDIQTITSDVPLLQPKILIRDIFMNSDSDCDPLILKSKLEYLSQKETECKTWISGNENAETLLKMKDDEMTIEANLKSLAEEGKVLPQNQEGVNDPNLDSVNRAFSDTNTVIDFPSLNPSMNGTASESESKTIDGKDSPYIPVKKGTSAESAEDFSNSSDDDFDWKEVFDCILKD